jgi:DNA-binding NarL/FixJ family response regulator
MIRVVIADDHPPLREGIKQRLEAQPDIQVVGEAGSGPELFAVLSQSPPPKVLVLDIQMPDFDLEKAISELQAQYPTMRILIVSAYDDKRHINQVMDAGVSGYVVKQEDMGIYVTAIREIAAGRTYFSQRVVGIALNTTELPSPSPRELEVLGLVARDATTDDIAYRLGISPRTVETHVKRVCRKLGVNTRAAAVGKAVQLGYINVLD